jgi:hypothetical protein
MRMQTLVVALGMLPISCGLAVAQVTGRFYLDKEVFPQDEPIVIHFKVVNGTSETYKLDTTGLPGQPACSGYSFRLLNPTNTPDPTHLLISANNCVLNGQLSFQAISKGTTYTQDIDLRRYLDPIRRGNYTFEMTHSSLWYGKGLNVKGRVHFRVQ